MWGGQLVVCGSMWCAVTHCGVGVGQRGDPLDLCVYICVCVCVCVQGLHLAYARVVDRVRDLGAHVHLGSGFGLGFP